MRLLNEALDQSERAGLTQHPIRARTFVTLGIVSLGGFRQRDQAVKYFRKALQIQPEVRLSPGLANPDIQAAFDEAIAGLSTPARRRSAAGEGAGSRARAGRTEADKPVPIIVVPDKDLDASAVVLRYRASTALRVHRPGDEEGGVGRLRGGHPGLGDGRGARRVFHRGAPGQRLGAGGSRHRGGSDRRRARPADDAGRGDWRRHRSSARRARPTSACSSRIAGRDRVRVVERQRARRRWARSPSPGRRLDASRGRWSPEIGYLVTPRFMIGVQGRLQLVRGATPYHVPNPVGERVRRRHDLRALPRPPSRAC